MGYGRKTKADGAFVVHNLSSCHGIKERNIGLRLISRKRNGKWAIAIQHRVWLRRKMDGCRCNAGCEGYNATRERITSKITGLSAIFAHARHVIGDAGSLGNITATGNRIIKGARRTGGSTFHCHIGTRRNGHFFVVWQKGSNRRCVQE